MIQLFTLEERGKGRVEEPDSTSHNKDLGNQSNLNLIHFN